MPDIISVKQLNTYVRSLLDGDSRLNFISVSGEISNFKNHYASGHLYFSLKDSDAVIRCVMFKGNTFSLKFKPQDSDKVICTGRVSVYEKDGQYQMYVENMVPAGVGELAEKFRIVKEKLEKEGLFSRETKRPLPKYPKKIAVITSSTGAALQDICNIISRRYPCCTVLQISALVQGENAPKSLINALDTAYETDSDIIIIGRGGGSAEDLSAFNDEMLARKIYESPMPVISAVGHETDFTICDFTADLRAPTPSAAAELAVPDIFEVKTYIENLSKRICTLTYNKIKLAELELQNIKLSKALKDREFIIDSRKAEVDVLRDKLFTEFEKIISKDGERLSVLSAKLDSLSPLKVLSRGYSCVYKNGKTVKQAVSLKSGDEIDINFVDGKVKATVK